jgi:hypothetical protein
VTDSLRPPRLGSALREVDSEAVLGAGPTGRGIAVAQITRRDATLFGLQVSSTLAWPKRPLQPVGEHPCRVAPTTPGADYVVPDVSSFALQGGRA